MRLKLFLAALVLAMFACGCNGVLLPEKTTQKAYNGNAVHNYALGRRYQAEGRFELARERYLQAMAMARDEEFRTLLAQEIESTDKAIRSLR